MESKWDEALNLPRGIRDFLDDYMEGRVALPVAQGYGVPVYMKLPSMLLFKVGESTEHSRYVQLEQQVRNTQSLGRRCVVVSGASGCGKTRSLYDLFCKRDGFFFTVSTPLNGGSRDLESLVTMLGRAGLLVRAPSKPGSDNFEDLATNRIVVQVLVTLLLACRMNIYRYCKSKGMESDKWLLLQAVCRGLARPGEDPLLSDPFDEFFTGVVSRFGLLGLRREQIACQLEPLLLQLRSTPELPVPTIALDEFQEAMKLLDDGYFWSASRSCYVPLANALEIACRVDESQEHVVIVSGTGYALHFKQELTGNGGAAKLVAGTDFFDFGIWESHRDMIKYAERAVELDSQEKEDLAILYKAFRGRFRPFACLLEIMILKELSLREAAAYVISGLTTAQGQAEMKKTCYGAVERLAKEPALVEGVNLVGILEMAVVQYFGAGRSYVYHDNQKACVALVEAGLGWLERTATGFSVHLDEYLVLGAARNFFQDQHQANGNVASSYLPSKWLRLSADVPYPSGQGLCLQNLLAVSFESMWERYGGRMADMPLLKPLLQAEDCPLGFEEMAGKRGRVMKGWIDAFVSADGYGPEVFLDDLERGQALCTTWVSGDNTSVRGISYELDDGTKYVMHVLEQHKFPKNKLSPNDMFDATGFCEDTQAFKLLSNVQLRLLLMPAQLKGDQPRHLWEKHGGGKMTGFVILDADNASDLFGAESALAFLRSMKVTSSALKEDARERRRHLPPPMVPKRHKYVYL